MTPRQRLAAFRLAAVAEFGAARALGEELNALRQQLGRQRGEFEEAHRLRRASQEAQAAHAAACGDLEEQVEAAQTLLDQHRARARAAEANARAIAVHLGREDA